LLSMWYQHMKSVRLLLISIVGVLALSACSLAGDIPPPPDYTPPAPRDALRAETNFPLMPPDPARGEALYATSCEPCHGETGMGDGSQSADLPVQVPLLGNADAARDVTPVDWFNTITYGNIERFMPPFGGSLTDRQRWDLVAYVYTLSMKPGQLAEGSEIYAAQCAECHGETGQGDGILAASQNQSISSWSDPARLAQQTNQQVWQSISAGVTGTSMPAFADSLSPGQLWAVTHYVRSLSFALPALEAASVPEEPGEVQAQAAQQTLPQGNLANVRVNVVNGSGEAVPENLQVTLMGFDDMQPSASLDGVRTEGNMYLFEGVEKPPQRVYLAAVDYNDLTFYSDILRLDAYAPGEEAQLNVIIYESTTDRSQLVAERVHIFLEFPEPNRLQVAQLFLISNPTGQVIVAEGEGQPVLEFELPEGAMGLQFADSVLGERYVQTARGFGDLANIPPGQSQHQVLYVFELPYDRKQTVQLKMPLAIESLIVALPEIEGLRLSSPQLRESGQRQVDLTRVSLFSAANLTGGSLLEMTVSGRAAPGPSISSGPVGNMILGASMFALVVIAAIFWLRQQRRQLVPAAGVSKPVEEPEAVESLLDAILALDDLYRSGELPLEAYKQRRTQLKERLRIAREKANLQEGSGANE
jgi:mono/diheme cytochrome c family protein